MASLDLSSVHIAAWRSRMPTDARTAIRDDARPESDAATTAIVEDFMTTQPRRVQEVFDRHDALLSSPEFGQARRVRLMSFLMNRAWPDTEFARTLMRDGLRIEREDGEGEGGLAGSGDGRPKVRFPVMFLEDFRSLANVVRPRMVRSVRTADTVEALANGLKDFADGFDAPPSGGL